MIKLADPHIGEREALEAAHTMCPHHPSGLCSQLKRDCDNMCHHAPWNKRSSCAWIGHELIVAYGRAVREADKEAARLGKPPAPAFPPTYTAQDAYTDGRADAAAAIEALEENK